MLPHMVGNIVVVVVDPASGHEVGAVGVGQLGRVVGLVELLVALGARKITDSFWRGLGPADAG